MFCLLVEIGGVGREGGFVGSFAGAAGEDVVGGKIYEENGAGASCEGEAAGGGDVEGSGAVRVEVAFVREAVGGAWRECRSVVNSMMWEVDDEGFERVCR